MAFDTPVSSVRRAGLLNFFNKKLPMTNYTYNGVKLNQSRKFHDAWALILFLGLHVVMITVSLTMSTTPRQQPGEDFIRVLGLQGWGALVLLFGINTMVFVVLSLLSFLALIYHPKTSIRASIIISAVLFLSPALSTPFRMIIYLIPQFMACLGILGYVYFFHIAPHIDYAAAILSVAAQILSNYIPGLILTFIGLNTGFVIQMLVTAYALSTLNVSDLQVKYIILLFLLIIFWSYAFVSYFYEVLCSSIVLNHINQTRGQRKGVFSQAISHTCMAAGSISMGALLLSLIMAMRTTVENKTQSETNSQEDRQEGRQEDRQEGRRGIPIILTANVISCLISWLHSLLFYLLQNIVEYMNCMVFPYIALHGTAYAESIVASFHVITDNHCRGIASHAAARWPLRVFACLACLVFIFVGIFVLGSFNVHAILWIIISIIFFTFLYSGITSMINAGVLALMYTKIEFPDMLKGYNSELAKTLEEKKDKIQIVDLGDEELL